jgi:hypothetical protein
VCAPWGEFYPNEQRGTEQTLRNGAGTGTTT